MRHRKHGRKLNRTASHRKALLRNLTLSLFEHERITTTIAKAKAAAPVAEKLITLAKRGTLADRRRAVSFLQGGAKRNPPGAKPEENLVRWIVRKLFDDIGPRYKDRHGGYTRVLRLSQWRLGDGGQKALLELVGPPEQAAAGAQAPLVTDEPQAPETDADAEPAPESETQADSTPDADEIDESAEPEADGADPKAEADAEEPEKTPGA